MKQQKTKTSKALLKAVAKYHSNMKRIRIRYDAETKDLIMKACKQKGVTLDKVFIEGLKALKIKVPGLT